MMRVEQGAGVLLERISKNEIHPLRWESQILEKNKWGRMIVKYDLYNRRSLTGKRADVVLIGKFFSDNRGQKTYQFMRTFRSVLSNMPIPPILGIPYPLFYDAKLRILFQEYMRGKPFGELVEGRNFKKYFRLAGKALASLHAQDISIGKSKFLGNHLRELIHPQAECFCEKVPEYKGLVAELIKAMKKIERGWKREIRMAPIHRDFHLRQLFYRKGRVYLIDWDLFSKGDPALDVGNFIVYLRTHLADEKLSAIDSFLKGYSSDAPSPILKRVYLYESFTYLRLACKCLLIKGKGWKKKASRMLAMSETCLLERSM